MNPTIRVMLCNDSSTMRRLIKSAVEYDARVKIVAEAAHGKDAIDLLRKARPNVVVLDVELPVMDGIETARAIRKLDPLLPIIMYSSLTSPSAEATLDALQAGASDFSIKPTSMGHIKQAIEQVRHNLIPKILSWGSKDPCTGIRHDAQLESLPPRVPTPLVDSSRPPAHIVAIGVSTGGPNALACVMKSIPLGLPVPIVIAQQMPPVFTKLLADRLKQQSGHDVQEACDGGELVPGMVCVAPGDHHLLVQKNGARHTMGLIQDPSEKAFRSAVDPMFCSVADCYGSRALGIVLTGMGSDGTEGAKRIKALGGAVYVQDESTSLVWGMPRKVFEAGCADLVLPLNQIGPAISSAIGKRSTKSTSQAVAFCR